jgi:hypothetical protein
VNCRRAKKSFPDLLAGGPADAAAEHVAICGACKRELEAFRRVHEAASRYAESDVPDPGEAYWHQFLPSLRARLALREAPAVRSVSAPRTVAAVAAAIMILAAAGTLRLEIPLPHASDPLVAAGQRLDMVFEKMPGLLPQVAADMLGTDPDPDIDASQILEAIDEIDPPSGFVQDWSDEDVGRMLDQLTRDQAARLRAELAAERG